MAGPVVAETFITLNAPIEKAWQILLDIDRYAQWNPFIIRAEGEGDMARPGSNMTLYVRWHTGGGATSKEEITDTKAPFTGTCGEKQAYWSYTFKGPLNSLGLVKATRYHWLEQRPGANTTTYRTREEFNGLLKAFIPLHKVQNGFERQTAAFKAEVERIA